MAQLGMHLIENYGSLLSPSLSFFQCSRIRSPGMPANDTVLICVLFEIVYKCVHVYYKCELFNSRIRDSNFSVIVAVNYVSRLNTFADALLIR